MEQLTGEIGQPKLSKVKEENFSDRFAQKTQSILGRDQKNLYFVLPRGCLITLFISLFYIFNVKQGTFLCLVTWTLGSRVPAPEWRDNKAGLSVSLGVGQLFQC